MTDQAENKLRERIALHGRMLYARGYVHGSTGNISVRLDDGLLITPTNSCLGLLDPEDISRIDWDGRHISGAPPSKEAFLHLEMLRRRPGDTAVVHLHSTHSVAVSVLADIDPNDALPPITAYSVMKVGRLPLVPYFRPGDRALADAVAAYADRHHAMLLANHGPVVSGRDLDTAVFATEELEETAKLYLLLKDHPVRLLTKDQIDDLARAFPS